MADILNSIQSKVILTFEDGSVYIVNNYEHDENKIILAINTYEDESISSGNPLGVMSSGSISLKLLDKNGDLNISKKTGKYYGKIKNGVRIELFNRYNNKEELYGTYYVTDWSTPFIGGANEPTYISGKDKLSYIGNKEIPKLEASYGITVIEMIDQVFKKIGINKGEYRVDSSLDLYIPYGVTEGIRVRDFLNNISQALLARVVIDRKGVINISPALISYGREYEIDTHYITEVTSKYNNANIYNKVRLHYQQKGESEFSLISSINSLTAKAGANSIDNITFRDKVLSVDQVQFIHDDLGDNINSVIDDIDWNAYQDGMNLRFTNLYSGELRDLKVRIYGHILNGLDVTEEVGIEGSDDYIENVLELKNNLVQDKEVAQGLVSNISDYISKTKHIWEANTQLVPEASIGDRLIIKSSIDDFNNIFKIIACRTDFGDTTYSRRLTLISEGSIDVWDDNLIWLD